MHAHGLVAVWQERRFWGMLNYFGHAVAKNAFAMGPTHLEVLDAVF
jgi:hypothetical protein